MKKKNGRVGRVRVTEAVGTSQCAPSPREYCILRTSESGPKTVPMSTLIPCCHKASVTLNYQRFGNSELRRTEVLISDTVL